MQAILSFNPNKMTDENDPNVHYDKKCRCKSGHSNVGVSYGLGFVGALVYYFHGVTTFWTGVVAILKAAVWPAFLVYHLMVFLKM
jgi:hypothetical protein